MSRTAEDVHELVGRYADAWRSGYPDQVAALHSKDSLFISHGRNSTVRGREALREEFAKVYKFYPNIGIEIHRVFGGYRHWALHWTLTFQRPGEERRGVEALDIAELDDDGLITRKDTFFDCEQFNAFFGGVS